MDLSHVSLPWSIEAAILAASLIAGTSFVISSFWLTIDSRLGPIREAFGVDVSLAPYIPQVLPILGLAGLFTGIKFHAVARRWLVKRIALV